MSWCGSVYLVEYRVMFEKTRSYWLWNSGCRAWWNASTWPTPRERRRTASSCWTRVRFGRSSPARSISTPWRCPLIHFHFIHSYLIANRRRSSCGPLLRGASVKRKESIRSLKIDYERAHVVAARLRSVCKWADALLFMQMGPCHATAGGPGRVAAAALPAARHRRRQLHAAPRRWHRPLQGTPLPGFYLVSLTFSSTFSLVCQLVWPSFIQIHCAWPGWNGFDFGLIGLLPGL